MAMKRTQALICCAGGYAIVASCAGCAQIFGFDKEFIIRNDGEGGGGLIATSGGPGVGGSGGAGADGSGGSGAGGAGGAAEGCDLLEVMPGESLDLSLIDDMEDGDIEIPEGDGMRLRSGSWFTYNDLSPMGVQVPDPDHAADLVVALDPPRPGSDGEMAIHTSANDEFTEYGAGVGVHLQTTGYYDASEYRGITFWARVEEGSSRLLVVTLTDRQVLPEGGKCGGEGQPPCHDPFHTTVTLSTEWKDFKVPMACLAQSGFGVFPSLLVTELESISFSFAASKAFDIWIDDVHFYK